MVNAKLLFELKTQREKLGTDYIMKNEYFQLSKFVEYWTSIYSKEISGVYRFGAYHTLSLKAYKSSFVLATKAILNGPICLLNYKCLFYIGISILNDTIKDFVNRRDTVDSYLGIQ